MPIRILMILHHFPPAENIAAHRARRLIRHLPDLGIEPLVVTGKIPTGKSPGSGDPSIPDLKQLEDVDGASIRVARTSGYDPVAWFQRRRDYGPRVNNEKESGTSARGKRLKRFLRGLPVPDDKIGWISPWIRAGLSISDKGVDLIYSTSAPYSAHVAAKNVARRLRLPWVMELRDLWSGNRYLPQSHNPVSRSLQNVLERRCLNQAWRVVVLSPAHARHLRERFPHLEDRLRVIPNTFDGLPPEPDRPGTARGTGPLRLLYAGNFYGGRTLHTLGGAVDAVAGKLPLYENAVLEVAGRSFDLPWSEIIDGVGGHRRVHGSLSNRQVGALLRKVHVGIVDNPSWDRIHIPGKLYEYLGAGLPVLDLSSQPDIPDICRGTVPCWKVDSSDMEKLISVLHEIADWWGEHPPGPQPPDTEHPFSSLQISRKLADLFKEVEGSARA